MAGRTSFLRDDASFELPLMSKLEQPNFNSDPETYRNWLLESYASMRTERHSASVLAWRQMYLSRAKLKASSRTSALLAGFAMVALVELQFQADVSKPLLTVFAVCTALLVSVHLLALMMSTCILPHMDAISNVHNLSAVNESPHIRLRWYIEAAWFFSTVLGLLLFLLEIAIVFWMKFMNISPLSAYISTGLLVPVFALFLMFTITFYRKLSAHKYEVSRNRLEEVQRYLSALESGLVAPPVANSANNNGISPPGTVHNY